MELDITNIDYEDRMRAVSGAQPGTRIISDGKFIGTTTSFGYATPPNDQGIITCFELGVLSRTQRTYRVRKEDIEVLAALMG